MPLNVRRKSSSSELPISSHANTMTSASSTTVPFPAAAANDDHDLGLSKEAQAAAYTRDAASKQRHSKGDSHSHSHSHSLSHSHSHSHPHSGIASHTWHHHPRQPLPTADSYFPTSALPKTPGGGSVMSTATTPRGHSRTTSTASAAPTAGAATAPASAVPGGAKSQGMSLSLSTGSSSRNLAGNLGSLQMSAHQAPSSLTAGGAGSGRPESTWGGAFEPGNGPPSPSTLTDIILGLHSTLYGGKRKPEEVREMVGRYYDRDAVFESPLLSARGHAQIANQFIMAFALPGMDVTSELRDVICSDFEFDGTRAGIIDQTISVTFLPMLFGSSASSNPGPSSARHADADGGTTPGYALQSNITPHPFGNYSSVHHSHAGASAFSHFGRSTQPHSPVTPFASWGNSRPHTPGAGVSSSGMRPLSSSAAPSVPGSVSGSFWNRVSTPPSVNGDDEDLPGQNSSRISMDDDRESVGAESQYYGAQGGQQLSVRPPIPQEALKPHWGTGGSLGRSSFGRLLWSLFHPRAALKQLCTINLRLMSRLEFNDVGLIVRHEDTWGLREAIEGIIPLASVIYAIERRVVGYLISWAVAHGVTISQMLLKGALGVRTEAEMEANSWQLEKDPNAAFYGQYGHGSHAVGHYGHGGGVDERAMMEDFHRTPGHHHLRTISRSRAPSPTRFRFMSGGGPSSAAPSVSGGTVTGTRSRARSLVGGTLPSRAQSTDNLVAYGAASGSLAALSSSNSLAGLSGYGERERGVSLGGDLPPDSGARYRNRRWEAGAAGRTSSTPAAPSSAVAAAAGAAGPTTTTTSSSSAHDPSSSSLPSSNLGSQATSPASEETSRRAPDRDQ